MSLRALTCPRCGGPLPPRGFRLVVVCRFCGAAVAEAGAMVQAADYRRALTALRRPNRSTPEADLPRAEVAGVRYRILGRVAVGESSDVFLAERDHPATERVLIKALRDDADQDLHDREWDVLSTLHAAEGVGAEALAQRLPPLVTRGRLRWGNDDRPALVQRALSGFVDTFDDVARAYPGGIDGRHASWMWRRVLELLGGVHRAGWVHGAVLPQHLVVHTRDHGVMLVGWSCAARVDARTPLPAVSQTARDVYPPALLAGAPPTPATDIAMSARAIARLLGGTADRVPPSVPGPFAALVETHAQGRGGDDAWAVRQAVAGAARAAYGPSQYHPLPMPGWNIAG